MPIFYRVSSGGRRIHEVEVDRSNDTSVWIGGSRQARVSAIYKYFETWESARLDLNKQALLRIDLLERQLACAKDDLALIETMTKPS